MPIEYSSHNFKTIYRDEYTGEQLPTALVRAAMEEELNYFNLHVWNVVEKKLAYNTEDFKLVRMRWVICNKGDEHDYDVRARLVACEVNTYKTDEYFASTPPLEAKKLLFSEFSATARNPAFKSDEYVLSFVDIKKAYFNGKPKRNVHLAFPKELGIADNVCAHLKRCVYGTRDAGAIWEECYASALVDMGFTRGVASPCCFFHSDLRLMVVVHGDDFTCLGPKKNIIHYEDQLASRFEIKRRGHIGESDGCIKEIRILNRILRLTDNGLRYEADPRHAEMLVKALGLDNASSVLTPGIKEDNNATDYDAQRVDEIVATPDWPTSDSSIAATLVIPNSAGRNVSFDLENTVFHDVVAYSDIYMVFIPEKSLLLGMAGGGYHLGLTLTLANLSELGLDELHHSWYQPSGTTLMLSVGAQSMLLLGMANLGMHRQSLMMSSLPTLMSMHLLMLFALLPPRRKMPVAKERKRSSALKWRATSMISLIQKMPPPFVLSALAAISLHKIGLTSVSQPRNSAESLRRLRMLPMSG